MSVQRRDPEMERLVWRDIDTGWDWFVTIQRTYPQAHNLPLDGLPPPVNLSVTEYRIAFTRARNEALRCRVRYDGEAKFGHELTDEEVRQAWAEVPPGCRTRTH